MNQKQWQYLTLFLLVLLLGTLVFALVKFKKDSWYCVDNTEKYLIEGMANANKEPVQCECKTISYPQTRSYRWYSENYPMERVVFNFSDSFG